MVPVQIGVAVQIPNGMEGWSVGNSFSGAADANFTVMFPLYL
jgi:hypothetical protein